MNGSVQYQEHCYKGNCKFFENHSVIYQYLRDRRRNKIGVVLAAWDGQEIRVGYSKCHVPLDKFNVHVGIQRAIQRLVPIEQYRFFEVPNVPNSIHMDVLAMCERAANYFKTT